MKLLQTVFRVAGSPSPCVNAPVWEGALRGTRRVSVQPACGAPVMQRPAESRNQIKSGDSENSTDHGGSLRDVSCHRKSDFVNCLSEPPLSGAQRAPGQAGGHGPCSGAADEWSRFLIRQVSGRRENIISDCL